MSTTPKLSDRAMLCAVMKSLPGMNKKDTSTTSKVLNEHHAGNEAGYWSGAVWPKAAIHPPSSIADKLRAEIELLTGAYFVKGLRILPCALLFDAKEKEREIKPQFYQAVRESAARRSEWIEVMRSNQNGLFRSELYPATDEQFASMFSLELKLLPLPDADNFLLLKLAQDSVDEARETYEASMKEAIAEHEAQMFDRLMDPILNAAKVLTKLAAGEKTRVYNSLLGNIDRVVRTLPHLNLTSNPKLEELRSMSQEVVECVTTEEIKDNQEVAAFALKKVEAILQKMKGYNP